MTSDLDIYRSAKLVADLHRDGAEAEALKRADALAAKGDGEGEAVWLRIRDAVRKLQKVVPDGVPN